MLNSKDVLTSRALIDLNISHDEYVLMSNALKEYDNMKEEIKNLKTTIVHRIFQLIYETMLMLYKNEIILFKAQKKLRK